MCVYGELPSGPPPAASKNVKLTADPQFVSVTWSPVAGATTYTVEKNLGSFSQIVGSGLTRPKFSDPVTSQGSLEYSVTAVNSKGQSLRSRPATIKITKGPTPRMMMTMSQ